MFRENLEQLPSEVVLYWFTLCFYGYRQAAGRAALRTLLTHEEIEESPPPRSSHRGSRVREEANQPTLNFFGLSHKGRSDSVREALHEWGTKHQQQEAESRSHAAEPKDIATSPRTHARSRPRKHSLKTSR